MPDFFYPLAVLACPIGMGVMMWLMMRRGGNQQGHGGQPTDVTAATEAELARLRAEVDQLKAERRDAGIRP